MFKILGYDGDGIEAAIIPRPCGGCGTRIDSVYLCLDPVITADGQLSGIEAIARAFSCCGYQEPARLGAHVLADVIEHVNTCPNHGDPDTGYHDNDPH